MILILWRRNHFGKLKNKLKQQNTRDVDDVREGAQQSDGVRVQPHPRRVHQRDAKLIVLRVNDVLINPLLQDGLAEIAAARADDLRVLRAIRE